MKYTPTDVAGMWLRGHRTGLRKKGGRWASLVTESLSVAQVWVGCSRLGCSRSSTKPSCWSNGMSCQTTPPRGGGFRRGGILTRFVVAACKSSRGCFPVCSTNSSPPARRSAMTATSPGCPYAWVDMNTTRHAALPTLHRWCFIFSVIRCWNPG